MAGLMAVNLRVKVTNEPKVIDRGNLYAVVPGQIGFKQRDKSYINEWIDVLLSSAQAESLPSKGDIIYVDGQVTCEEYQGKKQWKVWAESVEASVQAQAPPPPDRDVPF